MSRMQQRLPQLLRTQSTRSTRRACWSSGKVQIRAADGRLDVVWET